jgi:signal transduction histidine kinase
VGGRTIGRPAAIVAIAWPFVSPEREPPEPALSNEQRRRLELELRDGAERRLERVADLVADLDPELKRSLLAAQAELRELARGIHPAVLTEHGLGEALAELASRSPVPVHVEAVPGRLPRPVEVTAYFICSEALANVAKYANASRARVSVRVVEDVVRIEIVDDGAGGADPSRGSGLRGLADRVEALGGALHISSRPNAGTTVSASLPVAAAADPLPV